MTSCHLDAYAEEMEPLRAERTMDAAQAAAYPHLGKGAGRWWDAVAARAVRVASAARSAITINGQPLSFGGLKQAFAQRFGSGFRE